MLHVTTLITRSSTSNRHHQNHRRINSNNRKFHHRQRNTSSISLGKRNLTLTKKKRKNTVYATSSTDAVNSNSNNNNNNNNNESISSIADIKIRNRNNNSQQRQHSSSSSSSNSLSSFTASNTTTSSTAPAFLVALIVIIAAAFIKALTMFSSSRKQTIKKKVVVIGGGFAGMQAVFDLSKMFEVTLVDTKSYFEYTPGALSAIVGGGPMRKYKGSGSSGQRIGCLHREYGKMCEKVGAKFAHVKDDGVKYICEKYVSVCLNDEDDSKMEKLGYDYLIIATGSNYAPAIKPVGGLPTADAKTGYARQRTFQREAERVAPTSPASTTTTLIIGGGVVGVELAADIVSSSDASSRNKSLAKNVVILAHDKNRLLNTLPKSASDYVENWFKKRNVRVELGQRFNKVNDVYVSSKDSSVIIEANETIFAVGSKPSTSFLSFENRSTLLSAQEAKKNNEQIIEIPLSKQGFIERDPKNLQIIGFEHIYAVGDCAMKPAEQFLASFAHFEAEYVCKRILIQERQKSNKSQLTSSSTSNGPEYTVPPRFMAISLGPWNGLFMWGDFVLLKGVLAATVKLLVELWFSNFMPMPYAILRLLPKLERRRGGTSSGGNDECINSSAGTSFLNISSS